MALSEDKLKELSGLLDPVYTGIVESPVGTERPGLANLGRKLFNNKYGRDRALTEVARLVEAGVPQDEAITSVSNLYKKAVDSPFAMGGINLGTVGVVDEAGKPVVDAAGNAVTRTLTGSPLRSAMGVGMNAIKANPGWSLGAAAGTAGSLAGLFDNDKIAGQLIGTAAGAAIPALAGMGLSPLAAYTVATGAGSLGALFDNLRSKKADERAAMARNPHGREEYVR